MKKIIDGFEHIPYKSQQCNPKETADRAQSFFAMLSGRRSVRYFSNKEVDKKVIEYIIRSAATAPSGANKQPWSFCAVSNSAIKESIRQAAEKEEKINYEQRMGDEWLKDLQPFATNWEKPFLKIAPWLIIVFKKTYDLNDDASRQKNYYVNESVGIACGMLIAAIHHAGLVTLTHTPSPMNFLKEILKRPENEKPFLLLPVGYPADEALVPNIKKKATNEILEYYD